jgi:Holliday junction resolvase
MNMQVLNQVTEATWQRQVEDLLTVHGWSAFHDLSGKTSGNCARGFPDLIAIRGPELLVLELKKMSGRATREQVAWIERFDGVEASEAYVVKPNQFDWLERRLRPLPVQTSFATNSTGASWHPSSGRR